MYAQLCRKLCEEAPNFDHPSNSLNNNSTLNNNNNNSNNTFRRLLLAKCQDEFENRRRASEAFEKCNRVLTSEEEEQRNAAKHKMLGNIKFIGELGKQGLLQEAILHQCVQQLLSKKRRPPQHTSNNNTRGATADMAQDLECLCQIMKTVGHRLDTDKAKALMDQYFSRMEAFACNTELPSRIRFMLQDVLELRANDWIPRRAPMDHGPQTIQQVREDAARDFGHYNHVMAANNYAAITGILNKPRRGLDDVFDPLPIGNLGTGPGVITPDPFPAYSSNMGRPNRGPFNNAGFLTGRQHFFNAIKPNQNIFQSTAGPRLGPSSAPTNNSTQTRDLAPRFKKPHPPSIEEIALRPSANSLLKNKPPSFTKAASTTSNESHTPNSILHKDNTGAVVVIKQDKNKMSKLTKDEVINKSNEFLNDFSNHQNVEEAASNFRDLNIPKKFMANALQVMLTSSLEKSESDRERLSELLSALKPQPVHSLLEAFKGMFSAVAGLEEEIPRVKSHAAGLMARAVGDGLCPLVDMLEPLEGGVLYPLSLLCLQCLHRSKGASWLEDALSGTGGGKTCQLLALLPPERSPERLADTLEERDLGFLCPLLRIQADLWRQLHSNSTTPASLYRWIKDTVHTKLQTSPGFINALVSSLVKHITMKTTLLEGMDKNTPPDKNAIEKEKEYLEKYKPIFEAFLNERPDLQVIALYSLQVHCYNCGFPKGMLLRWFVLLYDLEIIEEEAFLKWKEDVNDEYPGKGKALFQVNQWLTWLEQAEEEEEEEGEN